MDWIFDLDLCPLGQKAQQLIQQGQADQALAAVQEALKLAKESNEIETTAPMQRATSQLLVAGN